MEIVLVVIVAYALIRVLGSIGDVSQALLLPDEQIIDAEPKASSSAAKSIALAVCVILVVVIVMGVGAMAGVQP